MEVVFWLLALGAAFGVPAAILKSAADPIAVIVGYVGMGVLPFFWLLALSVRVA